MAEVKKINGYDITDYRITGVDTVVTEDSNKVVTSGAVYDAIETGGSALAAEIARATAAEEALDERLGNETEARETADTSLTTALTLEVSTRESADNNLQIAINNEISARTLAISTEASTRADADTTLTTAINNEADLRLAADDTLQNQINDLDFDLQTEATTRSNADTALSGSIDLEITNRTNADTALSNRISSLETLGRYLTLWNCTTGLPTTNPTTLPYTYKTGDYYRISNVGTPALGNYRHTCHSTLNTRPDFYFDAIINNDSPTAFTYATLWTWLKNNNYTTLDSSYPISGQDSYPIVGLYADTVAGWDLLCVASLGISGELIPGTWGNYRECTFTDTTTSNINYRPNGSSYTGIASTTVETENVQIGDIYFYDGISWSLQFNHISGLITDVTLDGTSVVDGSVAQLTKELYYCTYGTTLYSEIVGAITNGKLPVVKYGDDFYIYGQNYPSEYRHDFYCVLDNLVQVLHCSQNNGWSNNSLLLQTVSNLTNTISPESTSTQYPSAECVYNKLLDKQDDLTDIQSFANNKYLHSNATTGSLEWADADALPSQSGHANQFLKTNGATASWASVEALPSQTGHAGEFLTTNGTTASWVNNTITNTACVSLTLVSGTLSYVVTHGLNTLDVIVQIYDAVTNETIFAEVKRNSLNLNQVTIEFGELPPHNCMILFTAMTTAHIPSGEEVNY